LKRRKLELEQQSESLKTIRFSRTISRSGCWTLQMPGPHLQLFPWPWSEIVCLATVVKAYMKRVVVHSGWLTIYAGRSTKFAVTVIPPRSGSSSLECVMANLFSLASSHSWQYSERQRPCVQRPVVALHPWQVDPPLPSNVTIDLAHHWLQQ
jgi:hypothetical protein